MDSDHDVRLSDGDDVASDESFSDASSDLNMASTRKRPIATKRPATTASKRPRVTASKMPVASKRPAATKRPAVATKRPASKKMPSKRPITSHDSSDDEEARDFSEEEEEQEEEEEEEDEESEESEDTGPPAKRKKGGGTRSKFIDDAADVDLEADEEDEEEEAGVKDLEREMAQRRVEEREREAQKRRSALQLDPDAEAEEMRRLAKDVARRYGADEYDDDEEEDEELDDEFDEEEEDGYQKRRPIVPIQRRRASSSQVFNPLPSIRDPKLWLLRCKPGTEHQVICDLMNRSYIRASTQDALFIKTAFTTSVGSGYLYVEAEKEVHAQKAIANVRFVNSRKITLVPIKEMVQAITIQKKKVSVKRGDWVRLKRGIYKGDLAQIVMTADQGTQVTVKIIPRIDYTKLGNEDKPAHFTPKTCPAARLLNPAELREMGEYLERRQEPITGSNCIFFNNNFYKNGFLYKTMRLNNVVVDGVGATLSEVEKFQQRIADSDDEADNQEEDEDLLEACRTVSAASQEHGPRFAKGNSVKVIRGDLKHLTGVVLSIVDDKVTMMPAHEDLHEPITFPQSDLRKYFKLGDHVKVIRGEYKDETGLIVRVEDDEDVIVVFSDISAREMRVFAVDVIESSEVSAGKDTLGNYELHDLVSVRDSVGVIIKIEIGSVQVLDTKSVVMSVRLQDIGRRRNNRASVALDANSRQVAAGDAVKVVSNAGSHYSGVSGTVLHVFRSFIFVRSREVPDNGGIFVVRARSISLVGEHQLCGDEHGRTSTTSMQKPGATVLPAFTRGRRPQSHPLLNETVVIKTGPHKGLLGIVKDASDSFVRVELHSVSKTVNVPIGNVSIRSNNLAGVSQPMSYSGAQTPLVGSATPAWNAGARTPMHPGAMTPMHSAHTPSNDSAWNANAPMTPIHTTTPSVATPSVGGWDDSNSGWGDSNTGWGQTPRTPSAAPVTPYGGSNWDTPATPADPTTPHTPATPYTSNPTVYTPEPHTPYTPMSASYMTPTTPNPATPTPFTPTSPAPVSAGAASGVTPEDWVEPGLEVVMLTGVAAVVQTVSNGIATLVSKTQTFDSVPVQDLSPSIPAKNDRLMIIAGETKGQAGTLLGVDGTDGIVKTDALDINIIEMSSLCRLP